MIQGTGVMSLGFLLHMGACVLTEQNSVAPSSHTHLQKHNRLNFYNHFQRKQVHIADFGGGVVYSNAEFTQFIFLCSINIGITRGQNQRLKTISE